MNAPHDNVDKLRHAYQLWHDTRGASIDHWVGLMSDDVVMRSASGGGPGLEFTSTCTGKSATSRYFEGLAADWEMVHFTAEEFIAQGDRVVVLSRVSFRHRKTGKVAESPKADVFRFRDGQVVEFIEFMDTFAAASASMPG